MAAGLVTLALLVAPPPVPWRIGAAPVAAQARTADLPRIPVVRPDVEISVVRQLWIYYDWIPENHPGLSPFGRYCRGDQGDYCFEGDSESFCLRLRCHNDRQERAFVQRLADLARKNPDSPHAVLQAVYAAVRLERFQEAGDLLKACAPAAPWWCDLARGYVLHRTRRTAPAELHLRRGLERAPDELRCRLEDVSFLLPGPVRDAYEEVPCGDRDDIHQYVWWLADPFWVDDMEDRWAEHIARRFELLLHEERLEATKYHSGGSGVRHTIGHERAVVRRGPADSWDFDMPATRGQDRSERIGYASPGVAANHFIPESLSLTGLDTAVAWRLEATLDDEGYTRWDGVASALPAQVARFREGDSLVVALASDLGGLGPPPSPTAGDSMQGAASTGSPDLDAPSLEGRAFLVTSRAPDHLTALDPVRLSERLAFAATVPASMQVVGLEVLTPGVTARHRRAIAPLEADGPVLSDLLVFRPMGFDLPEARSTAVGLMHGSTRVSRDLDLGVYWEGYGLPENEVVRVSMTLVAGGGGGWLSRLGRAVGVTGEPTDRTLSWIEETGEARPLARSFTLDMGGVDPGKVVLTLRVELEDGRTVSRSRTLEVVE